MKYNLKRILCLVLCLSMVLSLCAVGAMAVDAGTANDLQTAVSAGGNVTLTADVAADITVPTGTTVNLNLNGYKLTNASGDTITVSAGATLTITGSGTVDNTTNGKGALVNLGGTVTINGGATLTRSAEGTGNSWYTIKNLGTMTIDNATITTGSNSTGSSSLIDNGWYNAAKPGSNDRSYPHETNAVATLTIKSGTFSGGMNTVKNDDASVLTIEDGTFSNTTGPVVLNWNEATIKGGTFNVTTNTKSVLAIGYSSADVDKGVMTISGGTFNAASADTALFGYGVGGVNGGTLSITGGSFTGVFSTGLPYTTTISGGTFSDLSCLNYLASGANVNVKLAADAAGHFTVPAGTTVSLDLNGKNITNTDTAAKAPAITNNGTLTVTGSGTVDNQVPTDSTNLVLPALLNNGTVNLNGGTFTRSKDTGVQGTGANDWYVIHNHGAMTINGASVICTATDVSAIVNGWGHASQDPYTTGTATLTINSGSFSGGIHTVKQAASTLGAGALTITGGTFTSAKNQDANAADVLAADSAVTISGGQFNGKLTARTGGSIVVSGGTFSVDPTAYLADGYAAVNTNGTYTIAGAVATIGTVKYATLADAVAAAKTGDTVTLLKDVVEGAGIIVDGTAGRTFTIDFGGHTYTVTHDPAGSTNTQSQCFQLLKGSTVTMKNGTITANSTALKMILQNYCNLTLEDMKIDATQGTNSVGYCMSNNCGKVNIIGSTSITAKAGQVAFDACWAPKNGYPDGTQVVLNTTGVINGNIEFDLWGFNVETSCLTTLDIQNVNVTGSIIVTDLSEEVAKANIHISGGKFFSDPTAYLATGYYANSNTGSDAATYPFVVSTNGTVATIGTAKYTTMAEAITAAKAGDTIQLVADAGVSSLITLNKNLTIDLNGHKLSRADGNDVIQVVDNATLTINGTTRGSQFYGRLDVGISSNNNGNIVLNGGTYSCAAAQTVLHINGTCKDSDVTIKNATITSPSDNGIQLNGAGTFLIEDSTITGATAVYVKSGTTTIRNSTLTGNMSPANYTYNGNGANATGDALVVDACNYPGGNPVVNIVSGSFSGTKSAVGYYQYNNATATITISGGNFKTAPDTALIKTGYLVKSSGSTEYPYTVSAGSVDTVKTAVTNAIDAATTPAAVAEAVQAVQATDPAVLTDPSTITKLGALETAVKANSNITTNATVATGENAPSNVTGVTVTNSALSVPDITTTTVTPVVVTIEKGKATEAAINSALENANVAAAAGTTVIPLDINLTVSGQDTEPKAPLGIKLAVRMTAEAAQKVVIVHIKNDSTVETIIPTVSVENNIVYLNFIATSLSEYVLVETASEINPNAYTITMVPQVNYVNGGDTITYDVYIEQTAGTNGINNLQIHPIVTNKLTLTSGAVETTSVPTGFNWTNDQFTFTSTTSWKISEKVKIGTLTCTVATGLTDGTTLGAITAALNDGITNSSYVSEASVKIVTNDVSYRNLTVTFGNTTAYAKYSTNVLYTTNTYETEFIVPTIESIYTPGKGYYKDTNWHLTSAIGTAYTNATVFNASATYVANVVPEYAVTVSSPAEVIFGTLGGVRTASGTNYASSARDVTFTVTAGAIYTPTVTYQIGSADPVTLTALDGTYTIHAASITGNVTITVTVNVAVNGCKAYISDNTYTPFSTAYAADKTLVLLNLVAPDTGKGYKIGNTTIYKLDNEEYGAGYNYVMLLPKAFVTDVSDAGMLTYVKQNISLTDTPNTSLNYNYNTNGLNGAKVADVQAAYDFMSLGKAGLKWTPSDELLLLADVVTYEGGTTNLNVARDGKIDDADILAFLYDYAKFPR